MNKFLSYTISLSLLCIHCTKANAEWERTEYDYPDYEIFYHQEYYDGGIVLEAYKITSYETSYTGLVSSSAICVMGGDDTRYPITLEAAFTNKIWDETYEWSGGNPPSDFS